jgi:ribosome maturation factor RimP
MDSINKKIRQIASDSAEKKNLFLVDIVFRGTPNNPVIEVFVDGEQNVSAYECAKVSNEIKKIIDEESLYKSYRLDVSSPGVERPLIYIKQFPKHINRNIEIQYKIADDVKNLKGELISVDGDVLTFLDKTEIKVKFKDIIKAKVLVSFNQRR